MAAPQNIKLELPYDQEILPLGIYSREVKTYVYAKHVCTQMFLSAFFIIAKLEITQMFINRWMDKQKCGIFAQWNIQYLIKII